MSLLFRRASLASLGLAVGLSALSLSPLAAQETQPAQPAQPADAAATPAAAPVDPNAVVATVDGKPITEADLTLAEGELSKQFAQLPPEQRRAAALSAAIEIKVLAAKAVADGLDKDPDFQRRAAFLQQRALHGEMVEKEVVGKITDADIRARYDKEIAAQPPVNEVHARHILVKTKEEAEAIIKKLEGGADFQKLASENTNDPSGKTSGGDLGFFGPGQMVPEFEATMAGTAEGSISQPFRSEFGWHILEVKARRDKDFSGEVRRNQVAGYIRDQKYQEELDAWLRKIREEAFVDIK